MKFSFFGWVAIFIFIAGAVHTAPRVALMDFSTDDNSYRSAQTGVNFTSLLQVQLVNEPGLEWVERAQLPKRGLAAWVFM